MREQTAAVVGRTEIARDIVRLDVRLKRWDAVAPGQFVHAAVEGSFLRRPISIAGADEKSGTLSLIVQRVGAGTARLSEYGEGDTLKLLSPLGRGFDAERLMNAGTNLGEPRFGELSSGVWLVGGGVGVAPLLLLAQRLRETGCGVESFAGFRAAPYVYGVEELERCGPLSTVVGGLVTDLLSERLKHRRPAAIAACGPVPMLKAVQALCFGHGVEGWLSLEARMGCGLGACLVCSCKIKTGDGVRETAGTDACPWTWKRVCADGPVFDAREVLFDD
jgi:dihydroorotate dehydrogenase electron transfer subunit